MRRTIILVISALVAMTVMPVAAAGEDRPPASATIWRSSPLNGPNGLYVSPVDGYVYVASVLGDEITVHDPRSGRIIDRIGPERGVHGPDDVVIAPDGTLYWTELIAGNVGMLKPDGTFKTQFVGAGVNPITLSDDGRLFVARDFLGDGLYELDPMLEDEPRVVIEDLFGLNGMDFGPDGLLYGPLFFGGAVVRIDVDAADPQPEVVADGFTVPGAVAFSPDGVLHAVDFAEGQVIRVDVTTGAREVLADIEGNLDNLAFSEHGRLYTTAFADGQLLTLLPNGRLRPLNRSGFIAPAGVAVLDGTVWVADFFSLRGFDRRSGPTTTFYDRFGAPFNGVATTNTVSADGDHLIVSGWFSNAVQVVDPADGSILEDIRTLAVPTNAVRHGDQLVAATIGTGNVVDALTGDEILGGLAVPLGLASDGITLYVGDWATGTIHAVAPDGTATVAVTGLTTPEGLAMFGDRLLVVEEALDRVVVVDPASGTITPIVEGLDLGSRVIPGTLPYGLFNGVATDQRGAIYVTSDGDNTVQVFKPARP